MIERAHRVRKAPVRMLTWQVQAVVYTPNAYDHRHGLPRLARRSPQPHPPEGKL